MSEKMAVYHTSVLLLPNTGDSYTKATAQERENNYRLVTQPGRVAQSVARLTQESKVPGSTSGPATYFCFSFR